MARWHIAWTRPTSDWTPRPAGDAPAGIERYQRGIELVIAARLREAGFEALCPIVRKAITIGGSRLHWRGRKRERVVDTPAIARYVLFAPTPAAPDWRAAKRIRGVNAVVHATGSPDSPAIVPEHEVRWLHGDDGDGVLEDGSRLARALERYARGARVEVRMGLTSSGGAVTAPATIEGDDGRDVHVLLELLGGGARATVPRRSVKLAPA